MFKKFLRSIVAVIAVLLVTSCSSMSQNEAYNSIRIGVILPLTGEYEGQGKEMLNGIELAVKNLNAQGGIDSRLIALVIRNSKADAENAENLMRDMIANDNVVAVVGGYLNSEINALSKVAEELKTPYVAAISKNNHFATKSYYSFETAINDDERAAAMIYYLYFINKFKRIAILIDTETIDNHYRNLGVRSSQFLSYFSPNSVISLLYKPESESFSSQINLLLKSDAEAVIIPADYQTVAKFTEQARKLGYAGMVAAFDELNCEKFLNMDNLTGDIIFTGSYSEENNSKINHKFIELFNKEYSCNPNDLSANAYEAILFLRKGLNKTYTPDVIAYNLNYSKKYPSVCGDVILNSQKKVLHPVYIFEKANKTKKLKEKISAYSLRKFDELK